MSTLTRVLLFSALFLCPRSAVTALLCLHLCRIPLPTGFLLSLAGEGTDFVPYESPQHHISLCSSIPIFHRVEINSHSEYGEYETYCPWCQNIPFCFLSHNSINSSFTTLLLKFSWSMLAFFAGKLTKCGFQFLVFIAILLIFLSWIINYLILFWCAKQKEPESLEFGAL